MCFHVCQGFLGCERRQLEAEGSGALTAVGVAPLLQVGVAVEAAVRRRDVLRGPGDGGLRHHRVGLRRLVHGLELQPLVVNPKIRRLQVFGVSFVLVGAVGRLGGGAFSMGWREKRRMLRAWKKLSCREAA